MRRLAMVWLAALVSACSSQGAVPTDAATGLPILDDLPAFRGSAAATEWRESSDPAEGFGAGDTTHDTIADLVTALRSYARDQDRELTIGFLGAPTDAAATLVVHAEGRRDETLAGDELVADLRRNELGWYIDRIRFRMHCRRGIDAEGGTCT